MTALCKISGFIVWFQKVSIPLEILRGGGVLEAKMFKGKYEPKLEFPGGFGGGFNQRNPQWGEYRYFLEQHIRRATTGRF